ncbi:MAG: DUF4430 domain-containing protein, partial [Peptococcaceae bacterium]|nr:DUF4430 domain-containing protein [Peptococcaceae bacterium]
MGIRQYRAKAVKAVKAVKVVKAVRMVKAVKAAGDGGGGARRAGGFGRLVGAWGRLGGRGLALLLVAVMAMGLLPPLAALGGSTPPTAAAGAAQAADLALDLASALDTVRVTIADQTGEWAQAKLRDEVEVGFQPGETVLEVVRRSVTAAVYGEPCDFEAPGGAYGTYIAAINGLAAGGAGAWSGWVFAVNNVSPSVGIDAVRVKAGDKIRVEYSANGGIDGVEWGTSNGETAGFVFSRGNLSYLTDEWGYTSLILTLPDNGGGAAQTVQITKVPGMDGKTVSIYTTQGSQGGQGDQVGGQEGQGGQGDQVGGQEGQGGRGPGYGLGEDIPVSRGERLLVVLDGDFASLSAIDIQLVGPDEIPVLLANIAASYVDSGGEWQIVDMAAYKKYWPDQDKPATSAAARENYINYGIGAVNDYAAVGGYYPDGEYAKAIIALRAVGIDPRELYPVNSRSPVNGVELLRGASASTVNTAVYALRAYRQGDYGSESQERALVDYLLGQRDGTTGAWGYEYVGFNADADITAEVLGALSHYRAWPGVNEAVTKGLEWLKDQQLPDGNFGFSGSASANSSAMVILALCELGIDPREVRKNGDSVLDGLLSFAAGGLDGFTSAEYDSDWQIIGYGKNATATEQGFRALIAAARLIESGGAPVDLYDFSANAAAPGYANGSPVPQTPGEPVSGSQITVTFRLNGLNDGALIPERSVSVPADAKVYHVFKQVLDSLGYQYAGAERGYVRSITEPGGRVLSEFDYGPNSGWLYQVNGELPKLALTDCGLREGDEILWYYTRDWVQDPAAGSAVAPVAVRTPVVTPPVRIEGGAAVAEVSGRQLEDALRAARSSGAGEIVIAPAVGAGAAAGGGGGNGSAGGGVAGAGNSGDGNVGGNVGGNGVGIVGGVGSEIREVTVTLPLEALAKIAAAGGIALNVKNGLTEIRLPAEVLGQIAAAGGSSGSDGSGGNGG